MSNALKPKLVRYLKKTSLWSKYVKSHILRKEARLWAKSKGYGFGDCLSHLDEVERFVKDCTRPEEGDPIIDESDVDKALLGRISELIPEIEEAVQRSGFKGVGRRMQARKVFVLEMIGLAVLDEVL